MYELKGTIKRIFDTQTFSSGFTKREFVVTTDGDYPQDIKLSFFKDKTSLLDAYAEGQRVNVNFDLRGNEYKERFYVDLNAWKIAADGEAPAAHRAGDEDVPDFVSEDDENLPF